MKTISQVIDEIAKKNSPTKIVDPRFREAIKKIVKQTLGEFQNQIFIDEKTGKAKPGVTDEVLQRCLEFMETK